MTVQWRDVVLDVRRLVLPAAARPEHRQALIPLARQYGLAVADDRVRPRPGDFWIGCRPPAGHPPVAHADPAEAAVAVLAVIAGRYGYPQPAAARAAATETAGV